MAMLTKVIPSPKGFCGEESEYCFAPNLFFGEYEEPAETFAAYAKKGLDLEISLAASPTADAEGIYLVTDISYAKGEYKLTAGEDGKILLRAADREGIRYGLARSEEHTSELQSLYS